MSKNEEKRWEYNLVLTFNGQKINWITITDHYQNWMFLSLLYSAGANWDYVRHYCEEFEFFVRELARPKISSQN